MTNLIPLTEGDFARIRSAERTSAAHRNLLASLPAMNAVDLGGTATGEVLPASFTVAAWNVERCLFPAQTAAMLQGADVVLLSEVDCGMARTDQSHTTAEVAGHLGMAYAFGVEFQELGLGSPTELEFCQDDFNRYGWHGNAILSRVPFARVMMLRFDDHGHWFCPEFGADPLQPRVGGRMALLAEVPTANGPVCVVSTHLESNAQAAHRGAQFDLLMDTVDRFAPDMPVIIGGDLNTGNHMPPDFRWQDETLFNAARTRGYSWDATADGTTTRPSLITRHPDRTMKLDWFAARGIASSDARIIPSIAPDGTPISDHDMIIATFGRSAIQVCAWRDT